MPSCYVSIYVSAPWKHTLHWVTGLNPNNYSSLEQPNLSLLLQQLDYQTLKVQVSISQCNVMILCMYSKWHNSAIKIIVIHDVSSTAHAVGLSIIILRSTCLACEDWQCVLVHRMTRLYRLTLILCSAKPRCVGEMMSYERVTLVIFVYDICTSYMTIICIAKFCHTRKRLFTYDIWILVPIFLKFDSQIAAKTMMKANSLTLKSSYVVSCVVICPLHCMIKCNVKQSILKSLSWWGLGFCILIGHFSFSSLSNLFPNQWNWLVHFFHRLLFII